MRRKGRFALAVAAVLVMAFLLLRYVEFFPGDREKAPRRARGGIEEHVYGGLPDEGPVLVRNGYVLSYDPDRRVPSWVAYHLRPDYVKTPKRRGGYARFRPDAEVEHPVRPGDYRGADYHRGHLAPYFAMGGDRDGDGLYAADGDREDQETVFEANRMSNIAPQHAKFNGPGGVWYGLETWVREEVVKKRGREVWVFAGCVFGPGEHERIGPEEDIYVPPMFFKIVIVEEGSEPVVLAFLFPHQRVIHRSGKERIFPYFLVSVDVIEALTGLNFLRRLEGGEVLEKVDTWVNWKQFVRMHP